MMELYQFNIQTNRAGQRILIVDNAYRFERHQPVRYEDFDGVLYSSPFNPLVESQFVWLNPITRNPFRVKPFFFNPALTRKLLIDLSDGLYTSIDDQGLIDEVNRIKQRIQELNFQIIHRDRDYWTAERLALGILRFMITRNNEFPYPILKRGSTIGYAFGLEELFMKHSFFTAKEYIPLKEQIIAQYNYIECKELISVVHLCPECFNSHLIYTETCPQCSSSDIHQETMIHHFRCANISPESSYLKEGKLICPKCSREVRHIGVDYDRPVGIYSCRKCQLSFSQPNMTCTCTSCQKTNAPETLHAHKVYKMHFTNQGIKALVDGMVYLKEDDLVKYPHMLAYNDFMKIIRYKIGIFNTTKSEDARVCVIIIKGDFPETMGAKLAETLCFNYPELISSHRKNAFYLYSSQYTGEYIDSEMHNSERRLTGLGIENVSVGYIEYQLGMNEEDFYKQLI